MKSILLVEDDSMLGRLLSEKLSTEYEVTWKSNKTETLRFLSSPRRMDLIILDVGLPDGNGFEIAEFLKLSDRKTPFIFLTAQSDATSRLNGYELGADEYIPKPFHLKELLIKIKHIFAQHQNVTQLNLESIVIDFQKMNLQKSDGSIEFPATSDLKVLQMLVENEPRVLSRDEILNHVWGPDKNLNHRTIDNTIVRLKKLIGQANEESIRSVRGVGYQWIKKDNQ